MDLQQISDDLLLADFGVSVTAGAVSGIGILDKNSELILQGQVVVVEYALTCLTAEFGNLAYGWTIQVDGSYFKVIHEPMRFADGAYCIIPLEKTNNNSLPVPPPIQPPDISTDLTNRVDRSLIYWDQATSRFLADSSVIAITVFTHNQPSPSATWVINHNLNVKPTVELYNSGSQEIEGDVVHTSVNQTIISFSSPVSGFARLI